MRKIPWMIGVAAALLLLAPTAAQDASENCSVWRGTADATSVPRMDGEMLAGFDVTSTGATGPLGDMDVTATLDVERFLADGSMVLRGSHRLEGSEFGTVTSEDHVLTTAGGEIVNRLEFVEGGTGFMITHGSVNMETGALQLEYLGVLCTGTRG